MPNIGLSNQVLDNVCQLLNRLLANEFVFYVKILSCHWRIVGPNFKSLHVLFQEQYEQVFEIIDSVAERIRQFNGKPANTLSDFSKFSSIEDSERDGEFPGIPESSCLRDLKETHELLIQELREMVESTGSWKDMGTNNFLTDIMQKHEKMLWFISAHISNNTIY